MNLKFWKKDDFSDFKLPPLTGSGSGSELGLPPGNAFGTSGANPGGLDLTGGFDATHATAPTMPNTPNFSGQGFGSTPGFGANMNQSNFTDHDDHDRASGSTQQLHGKDLEIIGAKLDAIKTQLDMLNMRLNTLEQRLPPQQETGGPKKPWY